MHHRTTNDKPVSTSSGTSQQHVDPYDDRSAELMDFLGMIYFMVEVFRTDESFGDELSEFPLSTSAETDSTIVAMSPPLPLILFQMIAGLKDKLPKGYPVKKVC